MKLSAGQHYQNGFGAAVEIVSEPHAGDRWFRDRHGNAYHEDGALVVIAGGSPRLNLVALSQQEGKDR
jgi:hypothetical protein